MDSLKEMDKFLERYISRLNQEEIENMSRPVTSTEIETDFYLFFWFFLNFFPLIFISWKLITLQYCSGFWHTLT